MLMKEENQFRIPKNQAINQVGESKEEPTDKKSAAIQRWTRLMRQLIRKHPQIGFTFKLMRFMKSTTATKEKAIQKAH